MTRKPGLSFDDRFIIHVMPILGPVVTILAAMFWLGLCAGCVWLGFWYAIERFGG